MNCKHKKTDTSECELLGIFNIHSYGAQWCAARCNPDNRKKQIAMLASRGIELQDVPDDIDLLEWIKGQPEMIERNKKGCGGGCGKMKNIAKGLGKLAALRILGEKPPMFALERGEQCAACEYRTFLNPVTWGIEAIKGLFTDKPLPINHEPGQFDILWCSKCGCNIEAAILVEDKTCMENKWPAISGENKE